ncbi:MULTISPECIES: hypothetical protein [Niastella]|uniref:Uncharacterized protein n=1 Tax=Niastella soli TaxID=2821487 RepID=A0ABS3Z1H7_9BACT|nr:hypothetical protein [Niastella soli]MBO9204008.1 hypothetical protein [Niastella soli]
MRKNWPYFIVASFLNAVLITGAFLEFKLRGIAVSELPTPQPTWYELNPFVFSGGVFMISFLLIMAIIIIKDLPSYVKTTAGKVGGVSNKLQTFNDSLANPQATPVSGPFDVA